MAQLQPYADQGQQFLQPQAQGATLAGFGQNMGDIYNSPALQPMIDERMRDATSYMASQGLSRSGGAVQAAADIPAELAMQLEQMLYGRGTNQLETGYNASQNLAGLGQGDAANIANLYGNQGSAQASGILGKQQARQAGFSNIVGAGSGALSGLGAAGVGGGGMLTGLMSAFSDIRLKENIVPLCKIGGLTFCEWDWKGDIAEFLDENGFTNINKGFIAQEVAEKYPQHSGEMHGYLTIDYASLMEEIECLH